MQIVRRAQLFLRKFTLIFSTMEENSSNQRSIQAKIESSTAIKQFSSRKYIIQIYRMGLFTSRFISQLCILLLFIFNFICFYLSLSKVTFHEYQIEQYELKIKASTINEAISIGNLRHPIIEFDSSTNTDTEIITVIKQQRKFMNTY